MKSRASKYSYSQVMRELESAGSAQTRKTYARHGLTGPMFGVSYAFLKKLDKKVQDDLPLAKKLWASGNIDARTFACWIAEEEGVTAKLLDEWARDVDNHGTALELANLAAFTKHGAGRSRKWRKMKGEVRAAMGWMILGNLAMQPDRPVSEGGVTDEELTECLEVIEANIHDAPNRTRQNMNGALISIGCRSTMTRAALRVAKRVGPVDVDQGDTSCKTRVAYDSIQKTVAHYKAKGKKPTDGSAGQRRRHC